MTKVAWNTKELTVGQLAERSGVAVSALHFYEAKGLLTSRRTAGNQRRYPRDSLRRVAFIRLAQRIGIPLKVIKDALSELPDERTPHPRGLGPAVGGLARRAGRPDRAVAAPA
ncbi:hypothetical protein GCM10020001_045640 [Nonomuraea salmonea]